MGVSRLMQPPPVPTQPMTPPPATEPAPAPAPVAQPAPPPVQPKPADDMPSAEEFLKKSFYITVGKIRLDIGRLMGENKTFRAANQSVRSADLRAGGLDPAKIKLPPGMTFTFEIDTKCGEDQIKVGVLDRKQRKLLRAGSPVFAVGITQLQQTLKEYSDTLAKDPCVKDVVYDFDYADDGRIPIQADPQQKKLFESILAKSGGRALVAVLGTRDRYRSADRQMVEENEEGRLKTTEVKYTLANRSVVTVERQPVTMRPNRHGLSTNTIAQGIARAVRLKPAVVLIAVGEFEPEQFKYILNYAKAQGVPVVTKVPIPAVPGAGAKGLGKGEGKQGGGRPAKGRNGGDGGDGGNRHSKKELRNTIGEDNARRKQRSGGGGAANNSGGGGGGGGGGGHGRRKK